MSGHIIVKCICGWEGEQGRLASTDEPVRVLCPLCGKPFKSFPSMTTSDTEARMRCKEILQEEAIKLGLNPQCIGDPGWPQWDAALAAMLRARNEAINQAAAIVDDYVTPDAEIPEERGNKRLAVLVVNETANDIATTIRQLKDKTE